MPKSIHRVLVTGASGKLGGPLCTALVQRGYQVCALRHRQHVEVPGVEEVPGDVADADLIEQLVSANDAIIHLATCKEDRDGLLNVSLQGTFNLLDAAMRTKTARRVILAQRRRGKWDLFQPAAHSNTGRAAAGRLPGLLSSVQGAGRGDVPAVFSPGRRAECLSAHVVDPRRR